MKLFTGLLLAALFAGHTAFAGLKVEDANNKLLGFVDKVACGTGLTCSLTGPKVTIQAPGANGTSLISGATSYFIPFPVTTTSAGVNFGGGTSINGTSSTVNLTQLFVPVNSKLTGIAVNNGGTCGTNRYIVTLFSNAGVPITSSSATGTLCSGANSWQDINFTAPVNVTGPQTYFVGVYMNGATDKFFSIPAAGEYAGLTGSVAIASWGTVSSVSVPTAFTSGVGPIVHTF